MPDWIKNEIQAAQPQAPIMEKAYREAFEPLPESSQTLAKIGEEFRKAVQDMNFVEEANQANQFKVDDDQIPPIPHFPEEGLSLPQTQVDIRLGGNKTPEMQPAVQAPPAAPTKLISKRGIIGAEAGQTLKKFEFRKVTVDNTNKY